MRTRSVSSFEAKANLSRYVADAERGIQTVITRHNRPVAKIVPAHARIVYSKKEIEGVLEKFRAMRRRSKGSVSTKELINAGRR